MPEEDQAKFPSNVISISETDTDATTSSQIVICYQTTQPVTQQILLATAKISLGDASGKSMQCRALLDSGCMSNFITHELARKLNQIQE